MRRATSALTEARTTLLRGAGHDPEVVAVGEHWDRHAEAFELTRTSRPDLIEGFKLARQSDPKLTAERYLTQPRE